MHRGCSGLADPKPCHVNLGSLVSFVISEGSVAQHNDGESFGPNHSSHRHDRNHEHAQLMLGHIVVLGVSFFELGQAGGRLGIDFGKVLN
jgi:hypothetical protein